MARPVEFTDEDREKVLQKIREGLYVETAVAAVGVSKETFYEWLRLAAIADPAERPKGVSLARWTAARTFSDAIEKARAEADERDLGVIGRAAAPQRIPAICPDCSRSQKRPVPCMCGSCGQQGVYLTPGQWTASAWRLERRNPKYAQVIRTKHSFGEDDLEDFATALGSHVERILTAELGDAAADPLIEKIRREWAAILNTATTR